MTDRASEEEVGRALLVLAVHRLARGEFIGRKVWLELADGTLVYGTLRGVHVCSASYLDVDGERYWLPTGPREDDPGSVAKIRVVERGAGQAGHRDRGVRAAGGAAGGGEEGEHPVGPVG